MKDLVLKEIRPSKIDNFPIEYSYETDNYYSVNWIKRNEGWTLNLDLKDYAQTEMKTSQSELFKSFLDSTVCFQAKLEGEHVGYLQVSLEWNNRLRIWDIILEKESRGKGLGTSLLEKVRNIAKEMGARMIVLETQSCNVPAIKFYMKNGFDLIGVDTFHYSNDDSQLHDVRLEFGLSL